MFFIPVHFNFLLMFQKLLFFHSVFRWLVLASLVLALFRSVQGYRLKLTFTTSDHTLRHVTATIAHIQLLLGILIYTQSPTVQYFSAHPIDGYTDAVFFGLVHISLMLLSITIITIGSAKAKRKPTDSGKFKTMLIWFSVALVVLFIAIPWPFSPLANRPYLRTF